VLLRVNHLPIVGANAIDYLVQQDDSDYTLKWEPHFAEAASSGDLGYTYGVYELYPQIKGYYALWLLYQRLEKTKRRKMEICARCRH
jgi:hypothetical protein